MLVELAIGDAYGFGFSRMDRQYLAASRLRGYLRHPRYNLQPGTYTQGTQMALAVAELVLAGGEWTRESVADALVAAARRDPRDAGIPGASRALARAASGRELLGGRRGRRTDAGAAMRAGPVGVFRDVSEVVERSRIQASVTHATSSGTLSAVASALMTHYFLHEGGPRASLPRYVGAHVKGGWSADHSGEVGANGMQCVDAALTALGHCKGTLSDLLRRAVAFGGETDAVAAIALADWKVPF